MCVSLYACVSVCVGVCVCVCVLVSFCVCNFWSKEIKNETLVYLLVEISTRILIFNQALVLQFDGQMT